MADSFTVYRGGTVLDWLAERNILLHDSFDNGLPLQGAVLGDSGLPAQYQLLDVPTGNAAAAAQESDGQLRLNPALASVSANAAGSPGRSLLLHLLTDTQTANLGLGQPRHLQRRLSCR